MAIELVMPRMGLTMEQGTMVAWLKQEGETVRAGEPLYEIETDKTTVEIEAPADGVLGQILVRPGETVPVGQLVGYLLAAGEAPVAAGAGQAEQPERPEIKGAIEAAVAAAAPSPAARQKIKASPAARRLAQRLGVALAQVAGTGPGGRVVAWNVRQAAAAPAAAAPRVSPVAQRAAAALGVDLAQVTGSGPGGRITRQDVELAARAAAPAVQPVTRAHRIMAERMAASFGTAPHFYLHAEADARQLSALRAQLLPKLEARHKVHLTLTDLLVKLCALALADHPGVMAQWTAEGLRQAAAVNIGVAVDSPHGLVVPVIRHADQLGLVQIARQREDLVERARAGKLTPADLEEGVFTLTNLGMFRVDWFEAILNPPQAAILAVGRIRERPVVENGAVIAAAMLTLSLSVDHRVLDGAAAARFLTDLVELIETPGLALR